MSGNGPRSHKASAFGMCNRGHRRTASGNCSICNLAARHRRLAKEGKTVPKPARPRLPDGRYAKIPPGGGIPAPPPHADVNRDMPWLEQAACRDIDTDLFYTTSAAQAAEALAYCNGSAETATPPCPVRNDCLLWALNVNDATSHKTDAILGGMTERQRHRLIKAAAANGRIEVAV